MPANAGSQFARRIGSPSGTQGRRTSAVGGSLLLLRSDEHRSAVWAAGQIIGDINPILRGWFGYFQHATPGVFCAIDGFVRRRLRAILRKQEKRPGFGRCRADHQRWTNTFFAQHGLFTLQTAYAGDTPQLESRVRENRTHGSKGGERELPYPYRDLG